MRGTGGERRSSPQLLKVRAALTQLASGSSAQLRNIGVRRRLPRRSCEAEPWPVFSSEEVAKHQTPSNGIWVSYKEST